MFYDIILLLRSILFRTFFDLRASIILRFSFLCLKFILCSCILAFLHILFSQSVFRCRCSCEPSLSEISDLRCLLWLSICSPLVSLFHYSGFPFVFSYRVLFTSSLYPLLSNSCKPWISSLNLIVLVI